MKNNLTKLYFVISTIDPRYLQLAYFVFALGVFLLSPNSPTEGGSGTRG